MIKVMFIFSFSLYVYKVHKGKHIVYGGKVRQIIITPSSLIFFYLWALSSYSLQDCDRIIKINVYYYGGNIYLCAGISKKRNCLLAAGSPMLNLNSSVLVILGSNDLITILCEIRKLYKLAKVHTIAPMPELG